MSSDMLESALTAARRDYEKDICQTVINQPARGYVSCIIPYLMNYLKENNP